MKIMNWYLVHTKPRQEEMALRNLQVQNYECYLPTLPKEKISQQALTLVEQPLFPRYLFIRLGIDFKSQSWSPIRSTPGVSRLVRFGLEPAKVDDDLVANLREYEAKLKERPIELFQGGDKIRVVQGPFTGIEGVFKIKDGQQRVIVLIEMMSKMVAMPLAPHQIKRLA